MRKIVFIILLCIFFVSCKQETYQFTIIDAPADIAERAYYFADLYQSSDTEYLLGGQDAVRRVIKIDCSGLIIMCYKYALVDTDYQLLENDMTANYMYENASTIISHGKLRKGDLIFMGEENSNSITHIAIFEKIENENLYFIDSTQKDCNGDGIDDINGVTRRHYPINDKRFKAYGIMQIKY